MLVLFAKVTAFVVSAGDFSEAGWYASWCAVTAKFRINKKVLLRESKRPTARRAASARYAGGGLYPIQSWWGVPRVPPTIKTWLGGTPSSHGRGVPPPSRPGMGYPPPFKPGMGTPPPSRPEMGYPPPPPTDLGRGNPPPESWTDTHLWKHNLPSYVRMRAVITCNNSELQWSSHTYSHYLTNVWNW